MSINAIQDVLDRVSEEFGEGRVREAMAELQAIRRAARVLDEWNRNGQRQDLDAARVWRVIEAIAKEEP